MSGPGKAKFRQVVSRSSATPICIFQGHSRIWGISSNRLKPNLHNPGAPPEASPRSFEHPPGAPPGVPPRSFEHPHGALLRSSLGLICIITRSNKISKNRLEPPPRACALFSKNLGKSSEVIGKSWESLNRKSRKPWESSKDPRQECLLHLPECISFRRCSSKQPLRQFQRRFRIFCFLSHSFSEFVLLGRKDISCCLHELFSSLL